jgi:hypothetical protein
VENRSHTFSLLLVFVWALTINNLKLGHKTLKVEVVGDGAVWNQESTVSYIAATVGHHPATYELTAGHGALFGSEWSVPWDEFRIYHALSV